MPSESFVLCRHPVVPCEPAPPLPSPSPSTCRTLQWLHGLSHAARPVARPALCRCLDPLSFPSLGAGAGPGMKGGGMGGGRQCRLMLSLDRPHLTACICACATLNPKPCVCTWVASMVCVRACLLACVRVCVLARVRACAFSRSLSSFYIWESAKLRVFGESPGSARGLAPYGAWGSLSLPLLLPSMTDYEQALDLSDMNCI